VLNERANSGSLVDGRIPTVLLLPRCSPIHSLTVVRIKSGSCDFLARGRAALAQTFVTRLKNSVIICALESPLLSRSRVNAINSVNYSHRIISTIDAIAPKL